MLNEKAFKEQTVLLSLITVDTSKVQLAREDELSALLQQYNQYLYSSFVSLSTDVQVALKGIGINLLERKNFMERIGRRSKVLIKQLFEDAEKSTAYFNELRTLVMTTPAEEICNVVSAFLMACNRKAREGTRA